MTAPTNKEYLGDGVYARMEQQAAAWRVRIKRRLRQRYGTLVIDDLTDGRCVKSYLLPPDVQAAVRTLTPGRPA